MVCIDKSLSKDQVENRIEKYILGKMTDEERGQFQEHFSDCDFCADESSLGQRVARIARRKCAYEEIIQAEKAKDYKRVIELVKVMRQLGYRESVYPLKEVKEKTEENITIFKDSGINDPLTNMLFARQLVRDISEDDETDHLSKYVELMNQAEKYKQNGQYEDALKVYKKLHKLYPFDKLITYLIAVTYSQQNKLDHAGKWFKNGLLIKPDSIEDLIGLGSIYLFQYKLLEAEEILSIALKIEPSPLILLLLGKVYLGQDKLDEAQIVLENAIKMLPEEPFILAVLGETYVAKHEFDKGEFFIEQARKLDPNNLYMEGSMAFLKICKNEFDEAIRLLTNLNKFKPNDESIIANLAVCYYETGIRDKAIKYITIAKSLAPNYQKIIRNFEIILGLSEGKILPMFMLHPTFPTLFYSSRSFFG